MASECWLYAGYTDKDGYGLKAVVIDGKRTSRRVHRIMYEALVGPIPAELVTDHLCNTPQCINPDHLVVTTNEKNVLRSDTAQAAINSRRTFCVNGHKFTPENTYYRPNKLGKIWRTCRECKNIRQRKYNGLRNN